MGLTLLLAQTLALATAKPDSLRPNLSSVALATRVTAGAMRMDGRLDEPAWASAHVLGGFTAREPVWGAQPTERTEARVLFDDDALYVAIRAHDSRADLLDRQLTRRDASTMADWLAFSVDPNHDRRSAYTFVVTAAGVQREVFRFNDTEVDETWNAVWQSGVSVDSSGWTAEFRVPFSQLRLPRGTRHRFGFDVFRRIARTGEWLWWRAPEVGREGFVSAYADLDGIEGVSAPRPREIQPYVLAGANQPQPDAGNPFARSGMLRSAGADLRLGLTSGLMLTAALNPDFGQVEADPAVVNLSASETFLPERRPFFAEGADLFRLGMPAPHWSSEALFYSRRIGRAPQVEMEDRGGFVEPAGNTTILGAAKLTGRLGPGWTVGGLAALTDQERAGAVDSAGNPYAQVVEPRTLYAVGRLARELRGGRTVAGLFGTLVARDLPASITTLRSRGLTAGASLEHRFAADRFFVAGQLVASSVAGSAEAIAETQQSSVHYYQRPDDGAGLDTTRTSLGGVGGMIEAGRRQGAWLGGVRYVFRTRGFETNDAGYQTWAGQTFWRAHLVRRWLTGTGPFASAQVTGGVSDLRAWNGERIQAAAELTATYMTRGNWLGETSVWYRLGGRDPMVLRGGPALVLPRNWFIRQRLDTDVRKRIQAGVMVGYWRFDEGRFWGRWADGRVVWRPSASVELQAVPRFEDEDDSRAYLEQGSFNGAPVYVVAQRRLFTTAMGLRANAVLSTRLSIEGYAEPFFSRGRVTEFRTVRDAHSVHESGRFDVLDATQVIRNGGNVSADFDRDGVADLDLGEPDFTVLSLRSNVVLRWEFKSPSALFVVWQHGRESSESRAMAVGDGMRRLRSQDGGNRLLVKLTYWMQL